MSNEAPMAIKEFIALTPVAGVSANGNYADVSGSALDTGVKWQGGHGLFTAGDDGGALQGTVVCQLQFKCPHTGAWSNVDDCLINASSTQYAEPFVLPKGVFIRGNISGVAAETGIAMAAHYNERL